ncbi:ATP-binding protein [Saccharicrinis fermentans]|uniref:ATP-binding protein n=1 Tax=Saccharicrinis fermentans TaxID=982 RepID=UPI001B7FBB39
MKKHEAVAFFNLINHLHEQTSVIITTNKSPQQWAEMLDDEVLATALLDVSTPPTPCFLPFQ